MGIEVKAGARLRSVTDSTEVVVVKAPALAIDLRCGGHPMVSPGEEPAETVPAEPGFDGGSLLGKRYVDGDGELEVLCSKAGPGSLSLGVEVLEVKGAKPLPASD